MKLLLKPKISRTLEEGIKLLLCMVVTPLHREVMVLLGARVQRFIVSRMRDFITKS